MYTEISFIKESSQRIILIFLCKLNQIENAKYVLSQM